MKLDNFLLVSMVLLGVFSIRGLLSSEFNSNIVTDESPVARLQSTVENVKRKSAHSLAWAPVGDQHNVYNFDQIFTHALSSTVVDFIDGPEVRVSENTLFRILRSEGDVSISLERGMVFAELGEGRNDFVFTFGGEVYHLTAATDTNVQILSDGKEASIQVLSGSASLTRAGDQEKASFQISTQKEASIQGGNDIVIRDNLIDLKSPSRGQVFYTRDEADVFHNWVSKDVNIDDLPKLYLHVAEDYRFRRTLYTRQIDEQSMNSIYPPGRYYWRIQTEGGQAVSSVSVFDVLVESAPLWIRPGQVRSFLRLDPFTYRVSLDLEWTDVAQNYLVEVVRNIDGEEHIHDHIFISDQEHQLEFDDAGLYQLRVRIDEQGRDEAVWSDPITVVISGPELEAPMPSSLVENSQVVIFRDNSPVRLEWEGVEGVDRYRLRVQSSRGEETFETRSPFFDFPVSKSGVISWEVQSIHNQIESEFSKPQRFEVVRDKFDPQSPEDGVRIELKKPGESVSFHWNRASGAKGYIFEIAEDRDFTEVVHQKRVRSHEVRLNISNVGTYYWRTRVITDDGEEVYSRPFRVTISPTPPPPRPEIEGKFKIEFLDGSIEYRPSWLERLFNIFIPVAQASADVVETKKVKISWQEATENIKKYRIQIFKKDNLEQAIIDQEVDVTYFIWQPPEVGQYRWRMAYVDHWNQIGPFSDLYALEVVDDRAVELESINLVSPIHGRSISPEVGKQILFRWEILPDSVNEDFLWLEFSSDLDFSRPLEVIALEAGQREYPVEIGDAFREHDLVYWRVRAVANEGEYTSLRRRLDRDVEIVTETQPDELESRELRDFRAEEAVHFKQRRLRVHYLVNSLKYEQSAPQSSFDIEGTSSLGLFVSYEQGLTDSLSWSTKLLNSGGKVFNEQSFRSTQLYLGSSYHFFEKLLSASLGANYFRYSHFSVTEEENILQGRAESALSLSPSLSFQWQLWRINIELRGAYQLFGVSGPELTSIFDLSLFSFGFRWSSFELKDDIEQDSFSYFLGKTFEF